MGIKAVVLATKSASTPYTMLKAGEVRNVPKEVWEKRCHVQNLVKERLRDKTRDYLLMMINLPYLNCQARN